MFLCSFASNTLNALTLQLLLTDHLLFAVLMSFFIHMLGAYASMLSLSLMASVCFSCFPHALSVLPIFALFEDMAI